PAAWTRSEPDGSIRHTVRTEARRRPDDVSRVHPEDENDAAPREGHEQRAGGRQLGLTRLTRPTSPTRPQKSTCTPSFTMRGGSTPVTFCHAAPYRVVCETTSLALVRL